MKRFRRTSAPVSLIVLTGFVLSLVPRQALAAPASEELIRSIEPSNAQANAEPVQSLANDPSDTPSATITPNLGTDPHATLSQVDDSKLATDILKPPDSSAQPLSLPTGENKTGVSAQSISVPKGPGTIQGMGESFSAQASTGIATFSVPFALPAARGDAQPSLGLAYSSGGGNGVAGIGWDVGVPYIARQTDRGLPSYQDQDDWYAEQDRFVFNGGQELVPVAALLDGEELPSWAAGWQYFRPRVEGSYLRFFWNRSLKLWRVQDKSGVILELGKVDGETDGLEVDPTSSARIFRWNLKRSSDSYGNEVRYYYRKDGNLAYLSDILDTPKVGAASCANACTCSTTCACTDGCGYAHHTRLVYESRSDTTSAFNRGWQTSRALRLKRVDVTSRYDTPSAPRELLRRYHLSYDQNLHVSLLSSLQAEGMCATSVSEGADGSLGSTSCPRLPAMSFGYTHVKTDAQGAAVYDLGYETLDGTVHPIAGSPKHSVNEDYTDLYDVNSDGLPDVVTMMPGLYNGAHAVWYQGDGGKPDTFTSQRSMQVIGVLGATASVITKHNLNVAALDLDGDATIDLVHMPKVKTYSVYTPVGSGYSFSWVGRPVTTSDNLDARIDLGSDADELRVFDVNGDGLVDVVKTSGTALEVWFALGRFPGGDGLFGSGKWSTATTAQLSMTPVMRCVPWSSTPVRFSDPDIKLADMNGDGLIDIVRVRKGDIRYWPGRGDGTFGTGPLGCTGGTFSSNSYVQMTGSPYYTDPDDSGLRFDDVNGDGTADLVQIRFQDVDVWYNVDGASWQDRRIIGNTPASPSYQQRVRLVDMNGSGTPDILWGDGLAYKYIDLAGGKRPWLLSKVENGLGKTTEVEYTTSTAQMLAAAATPNTPELNDDWTKLSPVVLHMVSKVTVKDNLGTSSVGRPAGEYITWYTYTNPVYDGLQREFRGFESTKVRTDGDTNSPRSESRSDFLLGERPTDLPAWKDNPNEALKGLPKVAETYSLTSGGNAAVYLSTTGTTYLLRKLYDGKDGRGVYTALARQTDAWLYDTGTYSPSASTMTPELRRVTSEKVISPAVTVRAAVGTKHTATDVDVDPFGNKTRAIDYGLVDIHPIDQIEQVTVPALIDADAQTFGDGRWSWRTVESYVTGSIDTTIRKHTRTTLWNDRADPVTTEVEHQQPGMLERADPATEPAGQAPIGWRWAGDTHYDAFGNVVFKASPGARCGRVTFDTHYALLASDETVFVGEATGSEAADGIAYSCGRIPLDATAEYHRVLGAILSVTDVNSARTTVEYDGFGRIVTMNGPDPNTSGETCAAPTLKVAYSLPDVTGRPVSLLESQTQDGDDCSSGNDADYHRTYAYVDGLGRTIVTLSEADPEADGFEWVVQGLTDYDKKGAERRKYLAWPWDGDPLHYDLAAPATTRYGQQRYDAFGRAIQTIGLDGTITLYTRYHALSADAWDAEDLGPGPHQGTYASEEKDGHGRVLLTTERVRVGSAIESRHVGMMYLSTGEVTRITRTRGGDSVSRTVAFDTLGRMVENVEDSTKGDGRGVRYVYDDAGNLIGTSDGRGCGVNFEYDAAGRLVSENYAPCEPHHAPYDATPEVEYFYDSVDAEAGVAFTDVTLAGVIGTQNCRNTSYTKGRLVATIDRGGKTLTCYDGRGRIVEAAKKLRAPDGGWTTQWFQRRATYDAADRPRVESTGATVNLAPEQSSTVTTHYTKRGDVLDVQSSYGELVSKVKRDADGLVTVIKYGDGAGTTTAFTYDDLRRLHNLTTYRSHQSTWPTGATWTTQMLLQDEEYVYDRVGNPVEIHDWRNAEEWPDGSKPVTRRMQYDDLYRLSRTDYQYPSGSDVWIDPFAAEASADPPNPARPQPSPRANFTGAKRPLQQTFDYDWLGNTSTTDDDAQAFYDRSLGEITNTGYQLTGANNGTQSPRRGSLTASYDNSGNLDVLEVHREGSCVPEDKCTDQHFDYEWDEVGRLVRARRWDKANPDTSPSGDLADADLRYSYDASDQRVRKTVVVAEAQRHTLYIFGSLELRLATFASGKYQVDETTEVPYLQAHGVRLARIVHTNEPELETPSVRVFLELGDSLGSTSVMLDHATGELVERSTAYAYGATESDHRPERWEQFREDYRFTGKEEDIEVGLQYFGKRFYAPLLQRWVSADPLAVHAPGQADLNLYAYVHGRVLVAVDPVGLQTKTDAECDTVTVPERAPDNGTIYREQLTCKANTEGTVFSSAYQGEVRADPDATRRNIQQKALDLATTDLPPQELTPYLRLTTPVFGPAGPAVGEVYSLGYHLKHDVVKPIARWLGSAFAGAPTYTEHLGSDGPVSVKKTDYSDAAPAIGELSMAVIGGLGASPGSRLGLGLDSSAAAGREGFRAWARRMGFKTFDEMSPRMPTDVQRINEAMRSAEEIHFNMQGFSTPSRPDLRIKFGDPVAGYTNYEYSLGRTQYPGKMFFWQGDQPFIGPHPF